MANVLLLRPDHLLVPLSSFVLGLIEFKLAHSVHHHFGVAVGAGAASIAAVTALLGAWIVIGSGDSDRDKRQQRVAIPARAWPVVRTFFVTVDVFLLLLIAVRLASPDQPAPAFPPACPPAKLLGCSRVAATNPHNTDFASPPHFPASAAAVEAAVLQFIAHSPRATLLQAVPDTPVGAAARRGGHAAAHAMGNAAAAGTAAPAAAAARTVSHAESEAAGGGREGSSAREHVDQGAGVGAGVGAGAGAGAGAGVDAGVAAGAGMGVGAGAGVGAGVDRGAAPGSGGHPEEVAPSTGVGSFASSRDVTDGDTRASSDTSVGSDSEVWLQARFVSQLWGFADDVFVRVRCEGGVAVLEVQGQLRLGKGDLNVNRARNRRLVAAVQQAYEHGQIEQGTCL